MVDLPEPKGYFGAESLFGREPLDEEDEGTDGLPVIRSVPSGRRRPPPAAEGPDLARGVDTTSAGDAPRRDAVVRAGHGGPPGKDGEARHSTMLVHTSSRVKAQCALLAPVEHTVEALRQEWRSDPETFRRLYQHELATLPASRLDETGVAFEAVADQLEKVFDDLIVRVDNSANCTERLSYPDDEARTVIAIGGNTLSRGLTLEGLVTSYFVRTANAYDTLLQMGRWFGYRPGYGHLQRIWMTDELRSWFADLATVEQEIRRDIARYEHDRKTPTDIAVRIRTHPQMMVTSAAKMRGAIEVMLSYGDSRLQTTRFQHDDAEHLDHNLAVAKRLVSQSVRQGSTPEVRGGRRILRDVPHDEVRRFLEGYRPHPSDYSVNLQGVLDHVDLELATAEDQGREPLSWNLVVLGKQRGDVSIDVGLEDEVPAIIRRRMNLPEVDHAYIKALMSRNDHRIDMGGDPATGGATFRSPGEPGVIILYPIDPQTEEQPTDPASARIPLNAVRPVIGLGLALPPSIRPGADRGMPYKTVDLSSRVLEEPDDMGDVDDD